MDDETKKQELKSIFKVGGKYTLYKIDECMAMTHKTEINVKEIRDDGNSVIFSKPKGRKRFILKLESRSYQSAPMLPYRGAIFEDWNQPIHCDTEYSSGVMRGNACYNFVGSELEIRVWIETGQLNPFFDKSSVLAIDRQNRDVCGEEPETVVFPEAVETGRHAVIDRILLKAS